MTTYRQTLSITVTMKLLYPSSVMSGPWRKLKNQMKIYYSPTLPQNQFVNMPHSNALLTLASCPINVNGYNTSFLKTLLFLDPVLLTSSALPLLNAILILPTLNPSNKKRTVPATTIVRKLKSRWRRCYRTALSNLVLVLWPALLCWLRKQIKHYDSPQTARAL